MPLLLRAPALVEGLDLSRQVFEQALLLGSIALGLLRVAHEHDTPPLAAFSKVISLISKHPRPCFRKDLERMETREIFGSRHRPPGRAEQLCRCGPRDLRRLVDLAASPRTAATGQLRLLHEDNHVAVEVEECGERLVVALAARTRYVRGCPVLR